MIDSGGDSSETLMRSNSDVKQSLEKRFLG